MSDRYVNARELADTLGLHVASVWRLVHSGIIPAPIYVGPSAPRWRLGEVQAALESRRMTPAEAAAARRAAKAEKAAAKQAAAE